MLPRIWTCLAVAPTSGGDVAVVYVCTCLLKIFPGLARVLQPAIAAPAWAMGNEWNTRQLCSRICGMLVAMLQRQPASIALDCSHWTTVAGLTLDLLSLTVLLQLPPSYCTSQHIFS